MPSMRRMLGGMTQRSTTTLHGMNLLPLQNFNMSISRSRDAARRLRLSLLSSDQEPIPVMSAMDGSAVGLLILPLLIQSSETRSPKKNESSSLPKSPTIQS